MPRDARLNIDVTADAEGLRRAARQGGQAVRSLQQQVEGAGARVQQTFSDMGIAAFGLLRTMETQGRPDATAELYARQVFPGEYFDQLQDVISDDRYSIWAQTDILRAVSNFGASEIDAGRSRESILARIPDYLAAAAHIMVATETDLPGAATQLEAGISGQRPRGLVKKTGLPYPERGDLERMAVEEWGLPVGTELDESEIRRFATDHVFGLLEERKFTTFPEFPSDYRDTLRGEAARDNALSFLGRVVQESTAHWGGLFQGEAGEGGENIREALLDLLSLGVGSLGTRGLLRLLNRKGGRLAGLAGAGGTFITANTLQAAITGEGAELDAQYEAYGERYGLPDKQILDINITEGLDPKTKIEINSVVEEWSGSNLPNYTITQEGEIAP